MNRYEIPINSQIWWKLKKRMSPNVCQILEDDFDFVESIFQCLDGKLDGCIPQLQMANGRKAPLDNWYLNYLEEHLVALLVEEGLVLPGSSFRGEILVQPADETFDEYSAEDDDEDALGAGDVSFVYVERHIIELAIEKLPALERDYILSFYDFNEGAIALNSSFPLSSVARTLLELKSLKKMKSSRNSALLQFVKLEEVHVSFSREVIGIMLRDGYLKSPVEFLEGEVFRSGGKLACSESLARDVGFVYLIRKRSIYKIGKTQDLLRRMSELKPDEIVNVIRSVNYEVLEKRLQDHFVSCRFQQSEYFEFDEPRLQEASRLLIDWAVLS